MEAFQARSLSTGTGSTVPPSTERAERRIHAQPFSVGQQPWPGAKAISRHLTERAPTAQTLCRILTAKPEPHTGENYTSGSVRDWFSGLGRWVPRLWNRPLEEPLPPAEALTKAKEAAAGMSRCGGSASGTIQCSRHRPPTSIQIFDRISLNETNIKLRPQSREPHFSAPLPH